MYTHDFDECIRIAKELDSTRCKYFISTISNDLELDGYYLGSSKQSPHLVNYYDIEDDKVFTFSSSKIISIVQTGISDIIKDEIKSRFNSNLRPVMSVVNIDVTGQSLQFNNIKKEQNEMRSYCETWVSEKEIISINKQHLESYS